MNPALFSLRTSVLVYLLMNMYVLYALQRADAKRASHPLQEDEIHDLGPAQLLPRRTSGDINQIEWRSLMIGNSPEGAGESAGGEGT